MLKKESVIFEAKDVEKILALFCKKKFPKLEVETVDHDDYQFEVHFKSIDLDEDEEGEKSA